MATPDATTGERWSPAGFVSATDHGGALLIINLMGLIITLASAGLRFYLAQRLVTNEIAIHKDDLFCFIATVSLYLIARHDSSLLICCRSSAFSCFL
jgi:hypothetical protein